MRVVARYSHLNGEEALRFRQSGLWEEIIEVIESVDAESCRTKVSRERTRAGRKLYSPIDMNKAFQAAFKQRGWEQRRQHFWTTADTRTVRRIVSLPPEVQKTTIEESGHEAISSYNQTDFVKERIAVEVQFGKYAFVAHDLFVKHMAFYISDVIDVGIEILPMKELEREMPSGVPYYERDLLNILRQGRNIPAVPLVIIGIAP
ncbi:MAG: restriction endonuclease [Dehalococcoidia bacterium]|nr:restriction endonuclease [Dehalococcoidia bacterium]